MTFKSPKKNLGQNFLQDIHFQEQIVAGLGDLNQYDELIEIGPGRGALTEHLIKSGKKVNVIEFDRDLAEYWRNENIPNLNVIESDVLKVHFNTLFDSGKTYGLAGNIPYNITSPILFKLLENKSFIKKSVLMIQKEVADRIVAKEGNKIYGILSILTQIEAKATALFTVPNTAFYPVPKVDSAVISLEFYNEPPFKINNMSLFKTVVKTGFNQRRKMLRGSIKSLLTKYNYQGDLDLTLRPEQLSIQQFVDFVNELEQNRPQVK